MTDALAVLADASSGQRKMRRKILITGTTGWLGKELATQLAANNSNDECEIYGLARRSTSIPNVHSLQADITSESSLHSALSAHDDFDVIVHLAGAAGWCTLQQGLEVNVNGTRNVIAATRNPKKRQRYVIASSVAVTGSCAPDHPPRRLPVRNEDGFVGSDWAYGLSKHMVEEVVKFISGSEKEGIGSEAHVKADYLLLRIGGVVTDPPLPLRHLETAIGETQIIEPADRTDGPPQWATFPEFPLAAIALSDILRCLTLAIDPSAEYKPGVRTVTAVGPSVFSLRPVVDVMTWYGTNKAGEIDMEYHRMPGNEYKPIYDTEAAERELGFVAKIDFRTLLFVEKMEEMMGVNSGPLQSLYRRVVCDQGGGDGNTSPARVGNDELEEMAGDTSTRKSGKTKKEDKKRRKIED